MSNEEDAANQIRDQQFFLVFSDSQPVNAELHSDAELQNEGNAHSDSKISIHERDEELPDRDVNSDSNAKRANIETRTEPRLSRYVRRHHPVEKSLVTKRPDQ